MLKIDNNEVREKQLKRLADIRATRDNAAVENVLNRITKSAETGEGNLLEIAVEAA